MFDMACAPGGNLRVGRVESLLFLLKESLDLLQAFLIFGNIEVLLDDSNKHVEHNDSYTLAPRK